jgi:phenylpropionate dioxygenase-like ring-hydroxylating dioxygenase large terminal subunit
MDSIIPSSIATDRSVVESLVARQPKGLSLLQEFYTDPDVFKHDMERIFARHWVIAGHVGAIPNKGDFFLTEIGSESVIVARGPDGQVRAMANVCRHRGANVCTEKHGNARSFACPYHGWAYSTDGALRSARLMPEEFDKSKFGLKQIHTKIIQGLIFISFADKPLATTNLEATLNTGFGPYDWSTAKVAHRAQYRIDANWKLTVENYVECYHCAPAHPEYSLLHAIEKPLDQIEDLQKALLERDKACGIDIQTVSHWGGAESGEEATYRLRYTLTTGAKTGSADGELVAPIMGKLKADNGGATSIHCGPASFCLAYTDHGVIYRFIPRSLQYTEMEVIWLVKGDAVEGKDYDLAKLTWLWDVTSDADKKIIEHNQRGVNSRYYEPGPFAPMEYNERRYVDWYLNEIA